MGKLSELADAEEGYWPHVLAGGALILIVMLASRVEWWLIPIIVFSGWFVLDMVSRAYLIYNPMESYKDDETETGYHGDYKEEKEAEVLGILSRYRATRWIVEGYEE